MDSGVSFLASFTIKITYCGCIDVSTLNSFHFGSTVYVQLGFILYGSKILMCLCLSSKTYFNHKNIVAFLFFFNKKILMHITEGPRGKLMYSFHSIAFELYSSSLRRWKGFLEAGVSSSSELSSRSDSSSFESRKRGKSIQSHGMWNGSPEL